MKKSIQHIIISRTDAIGDVVLTLPLCGVLRKENPNLKISFLGNTYTRPVVELSKNVDFFLNWDDVKNKSAEEQKQFLQKINADSILHVFPRKEIAQAAKSAKIKLRIGTRSRLFHWFTCNQLVSLYRKNSDLHEAQLNILLAKNILKNVDNEAADLKNYYNCKSPETFNHSAFHLIDKNKFNLIIHPKSKGSAREWGLENYLKLIQHLPKEKFNIFISGSVEEKKLLEVFLQKIPSHVNDVTGKFSLPEFISFISNCDGMVAASTGPLHIAAMLGKKTIGLYAPMRPIFPMRWKPIGKQTDYLVFEKENCFDCKNNPSECSCIKQISIADVIEKLNF